LKSDSVVDNDLPMGTGFGWLNIIMFYVELFMCIQHTQNWTSKKLLSCCSYLHLVNLYASICYFELRFDFLFYVSTYEVFFYSKLTFFLTCMLHLACVFCNLILLFVNRV